VGRDYEARHILSFEEAAKMGGSMAGQKEQTGEAHTQSLEDMLRAAEYMVEKASAVEARSAARLKRLPSESSSEEESSSSSSAEEEEEVEEGELEESEEESELEEGEIIVEEVPSAVVVWQC
jgi:hypothetical protein